MPPPAQSSCRLPPPALALANIWKMACRPMMGDRPGVVLIDLLAAGGTDVGDGLTGNGVMVDLRHELDIYSVPEDSAFKQP